MPEHQIIRSPVSTSSSAPTSNSPTSFNTISIIFLSTGAWMPSNDCDMLAKFDFKSKKISWEITQENGGSKIEFDWSNISTIHTTMGAGRDILHLQLQTPPRFYKLQADANPGRQPKWVIGPDFTNGQASQNRHFVIFHPRALEGCYNKLIKNKHLREARKRRFPGFPQDRGEGSSNSQA